MTMAIAVGGHKTLSQHQILVVIIYSAGMSTAFNSNDAMKMNAEVSAVVSSE